LGELKKLSKYSKKRKHNMGRGRPKKRFGGKKKSDLTYSGVTGKRRGKGSKLQREPIRDIRGK